MPKAKLTPTQELFLKNYKVTHLVQYPVKFIESEQFLGRKGEVLDALEAVPKFVVAAQKLQQSVFDADRLANGGDFGEGYEELKQVKIAAQQLATSYDPTNDLQTIDRDMKQHFNRAKAAIAEVEAARLTHRDAVASSTEEQAAIDNLLKKTVAFLNSADQELKDISFQISEVTRCCKLPAHQQQAATLAAALKAGTGAMVGSVIMKPPQTSYSSGAQTYYSPDEVRKSLAVARDQQLKELNSYNQRMDQVSAAMEKFPRRWVTTPIQQSLTDADKAFKKRDYTGAFNSLQTALIGATALANSYQLVPDLKQLDPELMTFIGKAKAAAAEVATVQAEHELNALIGDEAELALIDRKIPLATAFLPTAGHQYKLLSEHLNDVNRLCTPPDVRQVSTLIYNLRTCMQEIGPLLKAPGEFYAVPELRFSLAVAKPGPAVAAKLVAETNADTKALASAARIHQAVAQGTAAVPQMTIVPRANIAARLSTALAAVATGTILRNQMVKTAATASQVLLQMLQGSKDQAERIDLMLVIVTDDLDGLLKSSMPGVNWGTDPTLLAELADATRKDLANVITNRIVIQGNKETAHIGSDTYDFKEELGRGGLGIAKLFESKSGKKFVLKEPQTRANRNIPPDIQYQMVMASNREMANELRAHLQASQTKHPNVLKLEDLCIDPDGRVRAVMDVADGGDVQKLHKILGALSDLDVLPQAARTAVERDMAAQMLSGIAAMHGAGVVHHDLKGENVFLKGDGTVQVADFGSGIAMTAQGKTPKVTREIGTTEGYAPPGRAQAEHDEAFDVFTVGKILERDVGTPGKSGSTASSSDRLRQALTRSDADKRADLDAAAKTAYIAEVTDFRDSPEYTKLLKQVMDARLTAVGKFLKARSRLVYFLDICRCQELGGAIDPISILATGTGKEVELENICIKIRQITDDYYKAVIDEIKRLSAKDFKGTFQDADNMGIGWILALRKYEIQLRTDIPTHKGLVTQLEAKYQQVLGSINWDAVRTAMGGSKDKDKQQQQAVKGLAKAEMRLYSVLDAFDEVVPRITELRQAILALVQAKSGELQTIREAGQKFLALPSFR
jgi:serine/threonine protein kinase